MNLKYEPASVPQHISVNWLFLIGAGDEATRVMRSVDDDGQSTPCYPTLLFASVTVLSVLVTVMFASVTFLSASVTGMKRRRGRGDAGDAVGR